MARVLRRRLNRKAKAVCGGLPISRRRLKSVGFSFTGIVVEFEVGSIDNIAHRRLHEYPEIVGDVVVQPEKFHGERPKRRARAVMSFFNIQFRANRGNRLGVS